MIFTEMPKIDWGRMKRASFLEQIFLQVTPALFKSYQITFVILISLLNI